MQSRLASRFAGLSTRDRVLERAPQLRQFIMKDAKLTGKELGRGAYGCVEEVKVYGATCAGKRIYETLIDSRNEGADRMVEKYYEECRLLSSLNHPNIVQFLGICFLEAQPGYSPSLPMLVMERLDRSLDDLLENTPNIHLSDKCSILQDVARGLDYLHSRSPAVIHRDLTARNVLLNSVMVAKITDMGNARIVDFQPGESAKTMTKGVPGTAVYMPPEAFDNPPKYGPKLDMFSFGHLALFTMTQVFPGKLMGPTYTDKDRRIIGRSEVERRKEYMDSLRGRGRFINTHEMFQLITQCLANSPEERPSPTDALHRLDRVQQKEHEDREKTLLQELKRMKGVEGRKPTPPTGEHYVMSRGIRYYMKKGCVGGNTCETMVVVSVGSECPAGVSVQPRIRDRALAERAFQTHGRLPSTVTGLHEEAAADLMARASMQLQNCARDMVRLCLDVPGKQRSKQYYLNTIEEFLKHCKQPGAVLFYMGHSEEGTGNWCFKDGTISFHEIFALYRKHCPGKPMAIITDCCYSGQWTIDCAKTLDSLGIPPCGHRAREQGILIKVLASCQPDQKATEPCYSVEGVTVADDGLLLISTEKLTQQTSTRCDATNLMCCRGPDESCCSDEALKNWTWQEALQGSLRKSVQMVRLSDQGRPTWHCLLLSDKSEEYEKRYNERVKSGSINLTEWGYVMASGEGTDPPQEIQQKICNWMSV